MVNYDLVVIGAGPAGLAAAFSAYENGVENILIIERDNVSGGILNQCIHNGFGLHYFSEELTGPEYAQRFEEMIENRGIKTMKNTMVLEITKDKQIYMVNETEGYTVISAKAIILAMGCRERPRGAIAIPGDRPSGVFTAGTAQRYVNMEGYMVGKKVVILGSGDIGLIMARRMTLEGAEVLAVVEIMPYSNGLNRNIVQCLEDYNIPLYLSHTVTQICGKSRLEKVIVEKVDENRNIVPNSKIEFDCDTLLLSVGLIPENEITKTAGVSIDGKSRGAVVYDDMQTDVDGIFACGNVLHVHDLVDFVTAESIKAGKSAASYIKNPYIHNRKSVNVINGTCVGYTVPQKLDLTVGEANVDICFRVTKPFTSAIIEIVNENNEVIKTIRKAHMLPAEMEKVTIDKESIKEASCITINIEVKEDK